MSKALLSSDSNAQVFFSFLYYYLLPELILFFQIYFDCFEAKEEGTVPVEDILYYNRYFFFFFFFFYLFLFFGNDFLFLILFNRGGRSTISLEEESNCKSGLFGTPLFLFFKKIHEFVQEEVSKFIQKSGANDDISHLTKVFLQVRSKWNTVF